MKLIVLILCALVLLPGRTNSQVIINEIQVANVDMFIDPSFNYGGWIEFYNPTAQPADLGGVYLQAGICAE